MKINCILTKIYTSYSIKGFMNIIDNISISCTYIFVHACCHKLYLLPITHVDQII